MFVDRDRVRERLPGITGSAESVLVIDRSADVVTLSVSVDVLLAAVASVAGAEVIEAVLTRFADAKLAATASVSW